MAAEATESRGFIVARDCRFHDTVVCKAIPWFSREQFFKQDCSLLDSIVGSKAVVRGDTIVFKAVDFKVIPWIQGDAEFQGDMVVLQAKIVMFKIITVFELTLKFEGKYCWSNAIL